MAVTKTQIAKRALSLLGERPITSITDGSDEANAMNERFDIVRDRELARHVWNFARKRASLTADGSFTPVHTFSYAYALPSDNVRLINVGEAYGPLGRPNVHYAYSATFDGISNVYEVAGGYIETNLSAPLKIEYISNGMAEAAFPPEFVDVLAYALAADAAEELTSSNPKVERLHQLYRDTIRQARKQNAIQRPTMPQENGEWVRSRYVWAYD